MPRKSKERRNRGRGRGNNGQDREQPRPGRSKNGAAAAVSDFEEKRNLDEEKSEGALDETTGPSQKRSSTCRNQQPALSTEVKSEENAIHSARSQEERPGPSVISLRPQTAPFVKLAGNIQRNVNKREIQALLLQLLKVMYQSNRSFNIPIPPLPGNHRGILFFGKFLLKSPPPPPSPGQKAVQMPHPLDEKMNLHQICTAQI